jgi:hypothetical protein
MHRSVLCSLFISGVLGWKLDAAALAEIDRISPTPSPTPSAPITSAQGAGELGAEIAD